MNFKLNYTPGEQILYIDTSKRLDVEDDDDNVSVCFVLHNMCFVQSNLMTQSGTRTELGSN